MDADSPFEHTVHTFNVLKAYFTHWLVMISLLHLTRNLQTKGKRYLMYNLMYIPRKA